MHFTIITAFVLLATALALSSDNERSDPVPIRILPFGDSITWGTASPDGNGYRLELYEKLMPNQIDFLGSLRHGSMEKNQNEGHQGFDIQAIRRNGMPDFTQRPDVVLLMLGTNNIVHNVDREKAAQLLGDLIDLTVRSCPDAAILVATITPLRNSTQEAQRIDFNSKLPGVVDEFSRKGKHVVLVDMDQVKQQHINKLDKIHPTTEGYRIMAGIWYEAIVSAAKHGWVKLPVDQELDASPPKTSSGGKIGNEGSLTASNTQRETALVTSPLPSITEAHRAQITSVTSEVEGSTIPNEHSQQDEQAQVQSQEQESDDVAKSKEKTHKIPMTTLASFATCRLQTSTIQIGLGMMMAALLIISGP